MFPWMKEGPESTTKLKQKACREVDSYYQGRKLLQFFELVRVLRVAG